MAQVKTLRPGVFSQYTVTPLYRSGQSARYGAVAAPCSLTAGQWFASWGEAAAALSQAGDLEMREAIRILFGMGVPRVYGLPVKASPTLTEAQTALAPLAQLENLGAVVCALPGEALPAIKTLAHGQAEKQKEWIAYCGAADPEEAEETAGQLQSERVVLCCPAAVPAAAPEEDASALYTAAALAGTVLAQEDPAATLSGVEMGGLAGLGTPLTDQQVEDLLAGGVTPFETRGTAVECIRAVTTRTETGGQPDLTFLPLGTIRIIDQVMQSLREGLKGMLGSARGTRDGYDGIASQVTVILQEKTDEGLLTGFEPPIVSSDSQDPTVCRVEVAFGVAYAVNQIHLEAQIVV